MAQQQLMPPVSAVEKASGMRPHKMTVSRWMRRGILDATGNRVRLESKFCGGRRLTTPEWVIEFFEATSKDRVFRDEDSRARTPNQQQRDFDRAERELDRLGV